MYPSRILGKHVLTFRQDYLLTDGQWFHDPVECPLTFFVGELKDEEEMPNVLKANPHKSTYANMMLFLRYQVEDYAFNKKWGNAEALDAAYEKRVADKKKQRQKKFEKGLAELRRRTKESLWQQRKDEEHHHEFGEIDRAEGVQRCTTCGFEIEVEEL